MNNHSRAQQSGFAVSGNDLVIGGMTITQLADRVGRTPFYAYDRALLTTRARELRNTLPKKIELHYAVKANPMPALVAHMTGLVDGLDVASGGELQIALNAGMAPATISFAGPGKSAGELEQAVEAGVLINVESFREIRLLGDFARRNRHSPRVAVRVNPDFELKYSGMKMGGGPKQFGIDAESVPEALSAIADAGLDFEGFHIFSGSQNLRYEAICDAQTQAFDLAVRLAAGAPMSVRTVNLGGGFGIPYFPGEKALDVGPIGVHLAGILERAETALPHARLVIELGRFLVGEAGLYVCRVIDRKVSRGHVYLIVDGGLHQHLAASGNFGQVVRKNYPVSIGNRMSSPATEVASVVGPLCTPLDLLADRMQFPEAREGDLVVVFQSGAYGLTASPLGFLGHPPPSEVLV